MTGRVHWVAQVTVDVLDDGADTFTPEQAARSAWRQIQGLEAPILTLTRVEMEEPPTFGCATEPKHVDTVDVDLEEVGVDG